MARRLPRAVVAALAVVAAVAPAAAAQLPALPGIPLPPLPPLPGFQPPPPGSNPPRPDRPPVPPCSSSKPIPMAPRGDVTFPCDFPDPMVLRTRGTYYAYGTATGWERGGRTFPILSSSDLRGWRTEADALGSPPGWTAGQLWAPSVLHARGRYLLYYSALRASDRVHCLAVATAARPTGPFHDRGPIACRDRRGRGYIDAAPLVHRGRGYLFFSVDGPRHSLSVLPLSRSLLRVRGRRHTLLRVARTWQKGLVSETVEGPWPVRRGRRFYLFYSAGCWCLDYRMGYAVARHPMGPYRDARVNPVLKGTAAMIGPGGGSLFTGPGGGTWLAFHAWAGVPAYDRGGVRNLRVAPVRWRRGAPRVGVR